MRLVNATAMCASTDKGWASLGLDLGPRQAERVQALDARPFVTVEFWARKATKPRARLLVLFRDATAPDAMPQARAVPAPALLATKWQKHRVNLRAVRGVKLDKLVHVGFAFGADVGNRPGTVIYVDDVALIARANDKTDRGGDAMPAVYPNHWPYGSLASTAWFVFVLKETNPFSCP